MNKIINLLKEISAKNGKNIFKETQNIIVLEGYGNASSNVMELFNYMIDQKMNEKNKFFWLVEDENELKKEKVKNVFYVNRKKVKKILEKAKIIITENEMIEKLNPKTFCLHVGKGNILAEKNKDYSIGRMYDLVVCPHENLFKLYKRVFQLENEQILVCGFPKNDHFSNRRSDFLRKKGFNRFDKIVVWDFKEEYGEFNFEDSFYKNLSEKLKEYNMLLIINDGLKKKKIMNHNIKYFEVFSKEKIHRYDLLRESDGLITNDVYLYLDFLIMNKPIALKYDKKDINEDILSAQRVQVENDIMLFLSGIKNEIDGMSNQRRELNKNINRIKKEKKNTEFIIDEIKKALND